MCHICISCSSLQFCSCSATRLQCLLSKKLNWNIFWVIQIVFPPVYICHRWLHFIDQALCSCLLFHKTSERHNFHMLQVGQQWKHLNARLSKLKPSFSPPPARALSWCLPWCGRCNGNCLDPLLEASPRWGPEPRGGPLSFILSQFPYFLERIPIQIWNGCLFIHPSSSPNNQSIL